MSGVRGWAVSLPPRGAVVHEQALGQAIDAEDGAQPFLHRLGALVAACLKANGKARVVVDDGQGMAPAGAGGEVALEVHLPEVIGVRMLEPLPVALGTFGGGDAAVPAQDRRDGARAGHRTDAPIEQHLVNGAASPGGMRRADLEDGLLECRRGPAG